MSERERKREEESERVIMKTIRQMMIGSVDMLLLMAIMIHDRFPCFPLSLKLSHTHISIIPMRERTRERTREREREGERERVSATIRS